MGRIQYRKYSEQHLPECHCFPCLEIHYGGVSIGDTSNGDKTKWITRQLTGLAALSTNDYDAVNVAQLKASMTTLSSTDGSVKITPNITMMDPGLLT